MSAGLPPKDYERIIVENYCIIASSAVLWFEIALTFTTEVRRIWRRKFSGATIVYLLTRYIAVVERVFFVLEVLLWKSTDKACASIIRTDDVLVIINYIAFAAFTVLRIYGVWDRDWKPFIILVPLALVKPIVIIYEETLYVAHQDGPPFGCLVNWVGTTNDHLANVYSRKGLYDRDSYQVWYARITCYSSTARRILLLIQIVTITASQIGSTLTVWAVWPYFDQVLTVILLSRFLLNLRGLYFAERPRDDGSGTLTGGGLSAIMPDMHFMTSRVVGNLGATLTTTLPYSGGDRAVSGSGSGDGDSSALGTSVRARAREGRVASHRAGGDEIEEVERVREGECEYALEGEEGLEWYDDENPAYTLYPFEAGMVMSEAELAHPPGRANSPAELEPVTPASPANPETLATPV